MAAMEMDVASQEANVKYRLRKVVPVCSEDGPICSNTLYLSSKRPLTVGRQLSKDVQVRLLSKSTPLMISRKHASLHLTAEGKVFVEDHKSLNGVYVRDTRIKAGIRHQLRVGDTVAFGCGVGEDDDAEFKYYLEAVHSTPSLSNERIEVSDTEYDIMSGSPSKRQRTSESCLTAVMASPAIIESNTAQIKDQEEKIRQLSEDLKVKEEAQSELMNKLEETEKGLIDKLGEQRVALESERTVAENHLRDLLEKQLREKEETLKNEYDEQIRLLQAERDVVESNLQNELNCKLNEKDEVYQKALEQQKSALEQAMRGKELEKNTLASQLKAKDGLIEKYKSVEENQRQLESCLEELKKEIEDKEVALDKQKEYTKKVETDAKQTVIQTMEDEFTCIICAELFVKATTLPCAHSFCEICLHGWLRKKNTCPVCRRKLKRKVKSFRSVVLDSAIEKMVETMDDETRKRRGELIKQRDEQKKREDAAEGKSSSSGYGGNSRNNSGNNRSGGNRDSDNVILIS